MATAIQLLRSAVPYLRPDPGVLADGMPMVNLAEQEPGLYFRLASGGLTKIGPAHVGTTAPNSTPQGFAGNTKGELWVDTSNASTPLMKAWDGSAWVEVAGGAPEPSPLPPNTPDAGDLWFDTANGILNYWDGSQWVSLTESTPGGTSSNVQYNRNGEFFGTNTFTFDELTSKLSVTSLECSAFINANDITLANSLETLTAEVTNTLNVKGDTSLDANLTVLKLSTFKDNVTADKNLSVAETVSAKEFKLSSLPSLP
jgi:hypothetical protein